MKMSDMLEIGSWGQLQTRIECFPSTIGLEQRILYASDLHLTTQTDHVVEQLVQASAAVAPHLILLGGDMVDNRSGLAALAECVHRLVEYCPVCAVPGNHDESAGLEDVRACVETAGGSWLETTSITTHGNIRIDGKLQPQESSRAFSICVLTILMRFPMPPPVAMI
jgi:predicted MPP superfamily phosphohydrolase